MKWLVPLLVLASLAVAAPTHADATLDGVSVHTTRHTTQVVTVKQQGPGRVPLVASQ